MRERLAATMKGMNDVADLYRARTKAGQAIQYFQTPAPSLSSTFPSGREIRRGLDEGKGILHLDGSPSDAPAGRYEALRSR